MDPIKLTHHHRVTAEKILSHPTSHNIEWHDVESLLAELGAVSDETGHRLKVKVGSATGSFDRSKGKDLDEQQVVDVRHLLTDAGITLETLQA